MIVSKINFTSSNFDNFSLKKPTQTPTVMAQQNSVPTNNDEQNRNKNNLKKYTLIGAGIILATLLAFKGKSILNKFKKKTSFELKPQTPEIKPSNIEPPEIKPIKEEPKIEKPKIEKPVKPILPDRYALVDEYDKRTQARVTD